MLSLVNILYCVYNSLKGRRIGVHTLLWREVGGSTCMRSSRSRLKQRCHNEGEGQADS